MNYAESLGARAKAAEPAIATAAPRLKNNALAAIADALLARQEEIPLYRLSNRICFGLSETDILSLISGCAGRILESERHRRSAVSGHDLIRLTDRIHRAAGILRHACVLPMSECLRCLADLRLGASLGLLPDIRVESLTALLFDTLPASLSLASDPPASGDFNRDISRARLVRERLSQEA